MVNADRPAALGGTPVRAGKPYAAWPQWDDREREALARTLESGAWWSGTGEETTQFAAEFAAFQSARFGLALTNGTHTLEAALAACGVGEGDEVIVPAMTFVASASAVLAVNATPVIVDVDPGSLTIDLTAAEAAITPRTRAVVAVHVAGAACDIEALVALCGRHGLRLIEDCAHAHGSTWNGRGLGSFGAFGSFSFQASKLMTAGEGGALITNDDALRAAALAYTNCGRVEGEHFYHHATYGSNLRMTELQATILRAQLARFPEQHVRRNARARVLSNTLAEIPGLRAQARDARQDAQGYYCYVFHYDADAFAGLPLRAFEAALTAEGIPLTVSYPSLDSVDVMRTARFGPRLRSLRPVVHDPVRARHASGSTVWMEHRVLLASDDDVLDVARACARIQRHAASLVGAG